MSKELENLKKLMSFAFVMSENMVGLTKGNYDEKEFIKKTSEYLHKYNVDLDSKVELKQALQEKAQLEQEIGCPLKVRLQLDCDSCIYDENGIEYRVAYIYKEHFDCENPFDNDMGYDTLCAFDYKDYKITWWLKEDKSE